MQTWSYRTPNPAMGKEEPSTMEYTCNLSTWEIETTKSKVQTHLQLPSESEDSLGYTRPCLKKQTKEGRQILSFDNSSYCVNKETAGCLLYHLLNLSPKVSFIL